MEEMIVQHVPRSVRHQHSQYENEDQWRDNDRPKPTGARRVVARLDQNVDVPNSEGDESRQRPADCLVRQRPEVLPNDGQDVRKKENVIELQLMQKLLRSRNFRRGHAIDHSSYGSPGRSRTTSRISSIM